MTQSSHIIHRLALDVRLPTDLSSAGATVHQLGEALKTQLIAVFDEVAEPGVHIRIEHLTLELNITNTKNWRQLLLTELSKQLKEKLTVSQTTPLIKSLNQIPASSISSTNKEEPKDQVAPQFMLPSEASLQSLLHFLRHGTSPWWNNAHPDQLLSDTLTLLSQATPTEQARFKYSLNGDAISRKRLLSQFSDQQLTPLLTAFKWISAATTLSLFYPTIASVSTVIRTAFWETYWAISTPTTVPKFLTQLWSSLSTKEKTLFRQITLNPHLKKNSQLVDFIFRQTDTKLSEPITVLEDKTTTDAQVEANERSTDDNASSYEQHQRPLEAVSGQGFYINNAGLIIAHPFLTTLFQKLDYLTDGVFRSVKKQQRAIHALAYMSTGREHLAEHELLFNKILCGWPIQQPIDRFITLNKAEKQEIENLLSSIVQHWTALKNTSIDGLREGFILRDGKLTEHPNYWDLYYASKAQDILLDKLPWGISFCTYKWINTSIRKIN